MDSKVVSRGTVDAQTGYRYSHYLRSLVYETKWVDPVGLVSPNRIDLVLKIAFLQAEQLGMLSAMHIYRSDIAAQTSGTFTEVGNKRKDSFQAYLRDFHTIHDALANGNFDWSHSPVVLAADGSLANGAHRVACGLFTGQQVLAVQTEVPVQDCSIRNLGRRGLDAGVYEQALVLALPFLGPLALLFVWPSAGNLDSSIEHELGKAIFHKRIDLTSKGKRNLLTDLYAESEWFKESALFVSPLEIKVRECFPGQENNVEVFLFAGEDAAVAARLKQRIRQSKGVRFSVAHSTDTVAEARTLCELLLTQGGRHFVNHSDRVKCDSAQIATDIQVEILNEGLHPNEVIVDGSAVLALYGLRKMADLDLLCAERSSKPCRSPQEATFHGVPVVDLIFDPAYHFSWRGVKFLSLHYLMEFKRSRGEPKDLRDLGIIKALLPQVSTSRVGEGRLRLKWSMRYVYLHVVGLLRESPLEPHARRLKALILGLAKRVIR